MTDDRSRRNHQIRPPRPDDADARGEHDYGRGPTSHQEHGETTPPLRQPNSYVAGEHGTQQVTAPPSGGDTDWAENDKDQ